MKLLSAPRQPFVGLALMAGMGITEDFTTLISFESLAISKYQLQSGALEYGMGF